MRASQQPEGSTMNNAAIFKAAHYLTRETRQAGDSYQATFAAAIKIAYANFDKAMTKAAKRAEWASERPGKVQKGLRWVDGIVNEGVYKTAEFFITACMTECMDEIIEAAAEAREAAKKAAAAQQATVCAKRSRGRYVELAWVATENGLNRGKSWYCGEIDIQTKGAKPEWEGEAICYVYA